MPQLNNSFDMPIRVGFDMDGVLADFAQAFQAAASRLFADREPAPQGRPPADCGDAAMRPGARFNRLLTSGSR